MRSNVARAAIIAALAGAACSGSSSDDQNVHPPATADRAATLADSDSPAAHAGHAVPGDAVHEAAADHSGHVDTRRSGAESAAGAHATHSAGGAPGGAAPHPGHDAAAGSADPHVGHTAADVRAADHAAHAAPAAATGQVEPAHAHHTPAAADPHAGHGPPVAADAHAHQAPSAADPHAGHGPPPTVVDARAMQEPAHPMWMRSLGGGWSVLGMAQGFPTVTAPIGADEGSSLATTQFYLTQPAVMFNIESPGSRFTLRTTLNFEGVTLPDGELTFGGWGEGFIDKRHPHTLLHELMLSVNLWDVAGGALSISAGKGFTSYGTDDPMARPVVKYPTNHHLSQILERWTVNGVYLNRGWSVEAALFGGSEPEGPYDLSNISSFGDSWSARVARRFGSGYGPLAETEVSASFGRVREVHHDDAVVTRLYNAAVRHERAYASGTLYGLVEGSMSEPLHGDGYFSLLGETQLRAGRHQPYYRIEYATRPEFAREGLPGSPGFFRYDHDAHAIGATRWLINSVGYGHELTGYPVSARPFVEVQHNRVSAERGGVEPRALFGRTSFWALSAGVRVFLAGDPMRMGSYGILDPMTAMHRGDHAAGTDAHTGHH